MHWDAPSQTHILPDCTGSAPTGQMSNLLEFRLREFTAVWEGGGGKEGPDRDSGGSVDQLVVVNPDGGLCRSPDLKAVPPGPPDRTWNIFWNGNVLLKAKRTAINTPTAKARKTDPPL